MMYFCLSLLLDDTTVLAIKRFIKTIKFPVSLSQLPRLVINYMNSDTRYLRCPGIRWLTAPSSSRRGSTPPPASRWRPRAGWASSRRSAWAASRAGARGCSAATRRAGSCGRATSSSSAPCTATTSSPPSPAARTGSRWARALCVDSG